MYGAGLKVIERLVRERRIGVGGGCLFSASPELFSEDNQQLNSLLSSSSAFSTNIMASWRKDNVHCVLFYFIIIEMFKNGPQVISWSLGLSGPS